MTGSIFHSYTSEDAAASGLYTQLRDMIAEAKTRLWITVPWWDTSESARTLLDCALATKRRGVEVRVISRPDRSNDAALGRLRDAGVDVVTIKNIHDKYVLADDAVLIQSSNFTRKELDVNQNSGRLHGDAETVEAYELLFDKLVADRDALSVGQEVWTPASSLIPVELTRFLDRYKTLNPLQSMAVPAVLSATGHIMVVAPTSAGKTLVGEVAALRSIVQEGQPAVWLMPARALAAEVAQTAARWESLGIRTLQLTGEVNLSSEKAQKAQLWVATTEKFESMYRRSTLRDFLKRVGCLIIDEVHLVGDPSRGAVLESVIARLRLAEARTRIVALSATVANADELAKWFNATLITSTWRPTVLTTQIVAYDPGSGGTDWLKDEAGKNNAINALLSDLAATGPEDHPEVSETIGRDGGTLGSVLVFCGSKNAVRQTAAMLAGVETEQRDDHALVTQAMASGVGIHFRDAPRASEALRAFNDRKIGALVATSGLSTGVNTPARIVIIRDLKLGVSDLEVSQAQQMLGRAGRAGKEPEGFGYLLVPRDRETEWRAKLTEGYLVADQNGTLTITDLGKLTARLMIGVSAACGILDGLGALGFPTQALEAENQVLALIVNSVPAIQDLPINARIYEDWVSQTLNGCGHGLGVHIGHNDDNFKSRFAAAVAVAALREPGRLSVPRTSKMSRGELVRTVDVLPRYLAWLNALGELGESPWAPAVAGDLGRRLEWWNLEPRPTRGSGRLLWLLEQLLDPEHRERRMGELWARARAASYDNPNGINIAPHNVDVTGDAFDELIANRAHLVLSPPDGTAVDIDASPYAARIMVVANSGSGPAQSELKALGARIDLPVPYGTTRNELAADIVLYARNDFAYANLITDLPDGVTANGEAVKKARVLIKKLNPAMAVAPHSGRIRRILMRERSRTLDELRPQITPEPELREIAELLAGKALDTQSRVLNLQSCLNQLLQVRASAGALRSPAAVLKAGNATPYESECVFLALATSLGIDVGMAISNNEKLIALIDIGGQWHTATPVGVNDHIKQPLSPATLPTTIKPIVAPRPPGPVSPLMPWLSEFAPGSGEPAPARRPAKAPVGAEFGAVTIEWDGEVVPDGALAVEPLLMAESTNPAESKSIGSQDVPWRRPTRKVPRVW
ncbi:DEAD/DEAH box helicase [Gordonia amarae]|uniref:DEAD/DEAH box helicase n=1 Tax=Gordonia amarae TaxID=36821 RepID=UPI001AF50970|nr:DEAD/DEAH box helicase [Gordonia amarae]QHN29109.1 DEAD/DEAH box helicase [Gordonia amarae]